MNLDRTLLRVFPKYSLLPQLAVHWMIQLPNPQFGGHSCRLPFPHLPTSKIHHRNLSVLPPKSFIATVLIWSTSISHLNHCLPLIMGYTTGGLSMCLGYQEDGNTFPPLPHKHTKRTKKGGISTPAHLGHLKMKNCYMLYDCLCFALYNSILIYVCVCLLRGSVGQHNFILWNSIFKILILALPLIYIVAE